MRLSELVANIRKEFAKHSLSKNYDLCHNRDPKGTVFLGIDRFTGNWSGSNKVREVSRLETKWIYQAGAMPHLV